MVAALALTAAGVMPAHAADDTETPIILKATVSKTTIDVVDRPVNVTVRLEVQDKGSGVATGYPWLDPNNMWEMADPIPGRAMTLISGDMFHGTYETTFTFPEGIRGGQWTFLPTIDDRAGNHGSNATYGDGIGVYPTVLSDADTSAPEVTTSVSTRIVDITTGPAELVVTVEAQDAGVGIPIGAETMFWSRTGTSGMGSPAKNSSTDPHRAKFKAIFPFGKYDPANDTRGKRWLSFGGIADSNGNVNGEQSAGEVIVATRPLRAKLPALSSSIGSVTASWAAHSDVLGILEYETEFTGPGIVRRVRTTATEASTGGLPDGTYTARVRARNQLGWGEWTNASAPIAYIPAPLNARTPTISGTVKVGQTLTANPGTWTTGTSFAYQWLAGGLAVSGATGSTLGLGPGQVDKAIAVRVTGSKTGYVTSSKDSAATAVVAKGSLAGVTPTITGTARVGSTLTVNAGLWSPAPVTLSYQWYRSGVVITGATLSTYALRTSDLGKTITVKTAARKPGYYVTYKTSAATAPVATNVLTAPRPVIPATAAVGQTLTVKVGAWTPTVSDRTYQWKRNGINIPGATMSSYKVVAADLGAGLSIAVTGRKSGYLTKTVSSYRTSPVTR
jgi:hypothetical protein